MTDAEYEKRRASWEAEINGLITFGKLMTAIAFCLGVFLGWLLG